MLASANPFALVIVLGPAMLFVLFTLWKMSRCVCCSPAYSHAAMHRLFSFAILQCIIMYVLRTALPHPVQSTASSAGMVVHPSPGHHQGTLVNAVLFHCGLPEISMPTVGSASPASLEGVRKLAGPPAPLEATRDTATQKAAEGDVIDELEERAGIAGGSMNSNRAAPAVSATGVSSRESGADCTARKPSQHVASSSREAAKTGRDTWQSAEGSNEGHSVGGSDDESLGDREDEVADDCDDEALMVSAVERQHVILRPGIVHRLDKGYVLPRM
jgi:hypothetical protein